MANEIRIELDTLIKLWDVSSPTGEVGYRSIHHLIQTLLVQGGVWRDPPTVILTVADVEADFDEVLAARCDLLSQGKINEARPDEPETVEEE
tara:strand:- start:3884 stop:4159 length:276 start_codon:yes stop_codon:yes gene_type:complete